MRGTEAEQQGADLAVRQGEVARCVTELNDSFYKLTANHRYATLFVAAVDASHQTLHYVNAGQNPPLLFRNGASPACGLSKTESLDCGGPPVGILARSQYRSEHVLLHDGDVPLGANNDETRGQVRCPSLWS
jgi:serine phosphatase RsbU (regulator of sigma subunit)